jgi:hypothetical protein
LLTATAAGALLGALWFVPSANASVDDPGRAQSPSSAAPRVTTQVRVASAESADGVAEQVRLADTGSFDSTPYVVGGTLFLTLGAGFVVYSVRREHLGF